MGAIYDLAGDAESREIQRQANISNVLQAFGSFIQKNREMQYQRPLAEAQAQNYLASAQTENMKNAVNLQRLMKSNPQLAQQLMQQQSAQQQTPPKSLLSRFFGGGQRQPQQPQVGQPSLEMMANVPGGIRTLTPAQQAINPNQMGGGFQGGQVAQQQATQQQDPLAALEAEIEAETDFEGNLTTRGKLLKAKYNAEQMSAVMQDRFEKNRKFLIDNPTLSEDTKKAIGAVNYMSPLINNINSNIDKMVASGDLDESSWKRFAKDILFDSDFKQYYVKDGSAFKDSPYENILNDLEQMKITGFSIAGAAFTENEQKIIEQGFSPKGKSLQRWKKDISATRNYMLERAKAGTIGTTEARKQLAELEEQIGSGMSGYDYDSAINAVLGSDEE